MDMIYVKKKYPTYVYTFFRLCDQSYGKISVKSLSPGFKFNRTTMLSRLYLSGEDDIVQSYEKNYTENSLILFSQDIKINDCSKFCVIPFTSYLFPISPKEERQIELSFGSKTDTEEVLLLFDDVCNSFFRILHKMFVHKFSFSISNYT